MSLTALDERMRQAEETEGRYSTPTSTVPGHSWMVSVSGQFAAKRTPQERGEGGSQLLARERRGAGRVFSQKEMNFLLWGPFWSRRRLELVAALEREPIFRRDAAHYEHSRVDRFRIALRKGVVYRQIAQRMGLRLTSGGQPYDEWLGLQDLVGEPTPDHLHVMMFVPAIRALGTPEQREEWLPRCEDYSVVGCYAQTEMGHGTNLRGLETTATFLPETQEFQLSTPSLTSIKWWPGNMAKSANHALVMANLVLPDGLTVGGQMFIVPLRSSEGHAPMPGVYVGDIGPKQGYSPNDNGFLALDAVRIPRKNMLSKWVQVSPTGEVHAHPKGQLAYAAMMHVRAYLVLACSGYLGKACTIAIRYSCVRLQGSSLLPSEGVDPSSEIPVLSYPTQQYTLLPLLALSYGMRFTGTYMKQAHDRFAASVAEAGGESANSEMSEVGVDLSLLPELHANLSGLKALFTTLSTDGIETCRKSCGGHGYSISSGLPEMYAHWIPSCTYEGDNTVMMLQCGRFLVKVYGAALSKRGSKLPPTLAYLQEYLKIRAARSTPHATWTAAASVEGVSNVHELLNAFAHRSARLIEVAWKAVQKYTLLNAGCTHDAALSGCSLEVLTAATAHCWTLLMQHYVVGVESSPKVWSRLWVLYQALLGLMKCPRCRDVGTF